jgi:hypothetical protein
MTKHFLRLIGVLALAVATFIVVAQVVSKANLPPWEDIGAPPGGASRLTATWPDLVVETSDGHAFRTCGSQCWESVPAPDPHPYPQGITDCSDFQAPVLPAAVDLRVECHFIYGATVTYRAYGIDSDGHVFRWEETVGDMSWLAVYPPAAIAGAIVALLGLVIVGAFALQDTLNRLARDAASRGHQDREHSGDDTGGCPTTR